MQNSVDMIFCEMLTMIDVDEDQIIYTFLIRFRIIVDDFASFILEFFPRRCIQNVFSHSEKRRSSFLTIKAFSTISKNVLIDMLYKEHMTDN